MKRSKSVVLGPAFLALAAAVASGCGGGDDDPDRLYRYCADEQRRVVDEDYCEPPVYDDTNTVYPYFIHTMTSGGYREGQALPVQKQHGVARATSPSQRAAIGVPARGGFGGNGATMAVAG